MTEHFHEHRVLTDRDPQGLAYGLIQTFLDADDATFRKLVTAAVTRGPELFADTVGFLVDLVAPYQLVFSADDTDAAAARRSVQGLILARATGLAQAYDEIFASIAAAGEGARAVHLAVLAQLAASLVDAGHLQVPAVAFASVSSS